jgi:hypothetical protein
MLPAPQHVGQPPLHALTQLVSAASQLVGEPPRIMHRKKPKSHERKQSPHADGNGMNNWVGGSACPVATQVGSRVAEAVASPATTEGSMSGRFNGA